MNEIDKKIVGYLERAYLVLEKKFCVPESCKYEFERQLHFNNLKVELAKMIQAEEHKQSQPNWDQTLDKLDKTIDNLPLGMLEGLIMEMKNR